MPEESRRGSLAAWVVGGCAGVVLLGLMLSCGVAMLGVGISSLPESVHTMPPPAVPPPPGAPGNGPMLPSPASAPAPSPDSPIHLQGLVDTATGRLTPGVTCQVDVEQRPRGDGSNWCHAVVNCGGLVVYGEGTGGFFDCVFDGAARTVRGTDGATTREDNDAALALDSVAGTLSVRDDATGPLGEFGVEGHVTRAE